MSRVIIWQVIGMNCGSCERVIGNVLKDVPGVVEVEVSVKQSKAAVRLCDGACDPDIEVLNQKLSARGYKLYPENCKLPNCKAPLAMRMRLAITAILIAGLVVFLLSPLRKFVPSVSAGASVGAFILLGLVASVSSCLASTGGFMLAYSAEVKSRRKTALMHVGRLAAFAGGGAILGAIGGSLPQLPPTLYGIPALVLGLGLLIVSLNLFDLAPSLSKLGISLPQSFSSWAHKMRQRKGGAAPLLVGAATFILPCGFTQAAQALALVSGSAWRGALLMSAFAFGTLPVLLGVTVLASKMAVRAGALRLAAGAVMFLFAVWQIQTGLAVLGVSAVPSAAVLSSNGAQAAVNAGDVQRVQTVRMDVLGYGYSPNSFTVKKGVPVRWEINAKDLNGCNSSLVSRGLGISRRLSPGLNVINFTPTKTGTVAFSCGMGMLRGSFKVI